MSTKILDGYAVAQQRRAVLSQTIQQRQQQALPKPGLAVILVGDNPASAIYVKHKRKACRDAGIESFLHEMADDCTQESIHELIQRCNTDPKIHGILLQLPLPPQIDPNPLLELIDPAKDVDGFHPYNIGRLVQRLPTLRCCTPKGIISLLETYDIDLTSQHAVVVGASNIVGRPMALELLLKKCTISICHRFSKNLADLVKQADILVAAIGKPGIINSEWIKAGAIVIDVGFTRSEAGTILGDIDAQSATQAGWITPVPGGVGPMTVVSLLENTLQACIAQTQA